MVSVMNTSAHPGNRQQPVNNRFDDAIAQMRRRDATIRAIGLFAYIERCVRRGEQLPYPFSDRSRWAAIAHDRSVPKSWRSCAKWLLKHDARDG
jgi:hypothetical protein